MKRIYNDQGACTCHQASGDSWDCPDHYRKNKRFKEALQVAQLASGRPHNDASILRILRSIDRKNAEEDKAFWAEMFADLDRRGR